MKTHGLSSGFLKLLAAVFLTGCSAVYQHADNVNPCTDGSNRSECERWKKNYPKEYERYKERMRKNAEVSSNSKR